MLTLDSIPTKNPNILGRVVDNEAVLVTPEASKVTVLNEVGATIWDLIDGQRDVRQICAEICAQYQAEPQVVETEALGFLGNLLKRNIITTA
ncbi:MAG TPA: hypothetical protein DEH25_09875 [Chloroflexi bacterium]|nr:hypothetical protein [Chloroflexota bacterium]HBY08331.1 hypothetical protein [Chloroflexota bacterium]